MKTFTSRLFFTVMIFFMIGWSFDSKGQSCPENANYRLSGNGQLVIELEGSSADLDPELGNFEYHLFEYNENGYVYNPLDLGGDEVEAITLEFVPPNLIRFSNVPAGNYTLVLTGGNCSNEGRNYTELTPSNNPYFTFNPELPEN